MAGIKLTEPSSPTAPRYAILFSIMTHPTNVHQIPEWTDFRWEVGLLYETMLGYDGPSVRRPCVDTDT